MRGPLVWPTLLVAGCLLLLAGASLPQTDGDTMFYTYTARSIVQTGDWLIPHHPGFFFDKPPLTIWLMALSLRLLGDTSAALRVWQLLLTLLLLVVTYTYARLGAGREEALLAALLLLTSIQFFYQAIVPQQDIALTLFLSLTLYGYFLHRRTGRTARSRARALRWRPPF